jgi:hypothetical protein
MSEAGGVIMDLSTLWEVFVSVAIFAGYVGLICLALRGLHPWLGAR